MLKSPRKLRDHLALCGLRPSCLSLASIAVDPDRRYRSIIAHLAGCSPQCWLAFGVDIRYSVETGYDDSYGNSRGAPTYGELTNNPATVYNQKLTDAVAACVRQQAECGLDIITDGELSKPGFFAYVKERLAGFAPRPEQKYQIYPAEVAAFPEYYAEYFARAMLGGNVAPVVPLYCVEPIRYIGQDELQRDLDNHTEVHPTVIGAKFQAMVEGAQIASRKLWP